MFRIIKPYLARIDNIHCIEEYLYSKEISVAGQVDCIAEYKGKLSVVDFKISTKQRDEDYNYGNFLQCSAYAKMFEEIYLTKDRANSCIGLHVKMDLYKSGYMFRAMQNTKRCFISTQRIFREK